MLPNNKGCSVLKINDNRSCTSCVGGAHTRAIVASLSTISCLCLAPDFLFSWLSSKYCSSCSARANCSDSAFVTVRSSWADSESLFQETHLRVPSIVSKVYCILFTCESFHWRWQCWARLWMELRLVPLTAQLLHLSRGFLHLSVLFLNLLFKFLDLSFVKRLNRENKCVSSATKITYQMSRFAVFLVFKLTEKYCSASSWSWSSLICPSLPLYCLWTHQLDKLLCASPWAARTHDCTLSFNTAQSRK